MPVHHYEVDCVKISGDKSHLTASIPYDDGRVKMTIVDEKTGERKEIRTTKEELKEYCEAILGILKED